MQNIYVFRDPRNPGLPFGSRFLPFPRRDFTNLHGIFFPVEICPDGRKFEVQPIDLFNFFLSFVSSSPSS
jgi:hypothetical protein